MAAVNHLVITKYLNVVMFSVYEDGFVLEL